MSESLVGAYISGGTFNQVAGHLNEYRVAGDLIQRHGEGGKLDLDLIDFALTFHATGISLLQRNISGHAFYNSEQRFPPPQCHPTTRIAVQNTIQSWAVDEQGASIMWLYGPAGAGKSAIAQSMAENWATKHNLAAAFFFGRWRAGGGSGKCLFPTIAYQLALHNQSFREPIGLAVEADPAICDKAMEEQVRALIVDPIISCTELEPYEPCLVIIDGSMNVTASQCRAASSKSSLMHWSKIGCLSGSSSAVVPSRTSAKPSIPYPGMSTSDASYWTRRSARAAIHILCFLRDRFSGIRRKRLPYHHASWPSERDLDRLVHSASGQFIYAATVVKFVDDEYCHPVEQLCTVLDISATDTDTSPFADLDTLYTHILSTNPNTSLLVRVLGAYFATPEETRTRCVGFLDEILGLQRGRVRFALRGLHSILFIPDADDDPIRLHHASLHDFLSDLGRAGRFYLSSKVHHMDLAKCCLSTVTDSLYHPERYTLTMLAYAHTHWHHHYVPVSEQHGMIQDCLRCYREILCPTELNVLCRDAGAMTDRFMWIIDFLNSLRNVADIQTTSSCELTWDTLMTTLFEPMAKVLIFYKARCVQHHESGTLHISSSLGIVFQKLWNGSGNKILKSFLAVPHSRQRITTFLVNNPRPEIRFRAAEISLRILMCRTAEVRSYVDPCSYHRTITQWGFVMQWCTYLVQAPATAEILVMLRELIENTLIVPQEEIHHASLKMWLMNFGPRGIEIYHAFEEARIIKNKSGYVPSHPWVRIRFSQQFYPD